MGIKGIYKEIGAGERVSLCKIATEHLERHPLRPFRLAIDVSIWQFQIQAARGGTNPAIRTMFYRLVRMLGHGIEPVFVFDGPEKPEFKRNKRSGRGAGARVSDAIAKNLIRHFGFVAHQAPGEAEAECALLQINGIVDAVLSEDVDTIMFGCERTFRNWSSEGSTSKTPTHVTVHDATKIAAGPSRLDRQGMVLIALMSGGDYIPEGIPGCGIKVACEAARAGFGRDLCRLKRSDTHGLKAWRQKLVTELHSNESGFFRTKHKALVVPPDFPNLDVLRYYTHPVVSNADAIKRLDEKLLTQRSIDIEALRTFTRETFEWDYKQGAIKFIRVLGPSMLVQRLVKSLEATDRFGDDFDAKEEYEANIITKIKSRRTHASTGQIPELRVAFIPSKMVGIDPSLEAEAPPTSSGRSGLALNSDDEFEEEAGEPEKKTTAKKPFDPCEADLAWVPESIVEMGVPLMAGDFKDQQRSKQTIKPKATRTKKYTATGSGPMDQFMTKVVKLPPSSAPVPATKKALPRVPQRASSQSVSLEPIDSEDDFDLPSLSQAGKPAVKPAKKATGTGPKKRTPKKTSKAKPAVSSDTNPWTIAKSGLTPSKPKTAAPTAAKRPPSFTNSPIIISSSPAAVPTKTSPLKSFGRVTPTKRTSAGSSAGLSSGEEPPSPTPGPRTLHSPSLAREPPAPSPRRARQFKRTKSGAEEDPEPVQTQPPPSQTQLPPTQTQPPSTQKKNLLQTKLNHVLSGVSASKPKPSTSASTSAPKTRAAPLPAPLQRIKGYMPVTKRAAAPPTKPHVDSNPIIIPDSSSDDDEDDELPDLLRRSREPSNPPPKPKTAPLPPTQTARAVPKPQAQKMAPTPPAPPLGEKKKVKPTSTSNSPESRQTSLPLRPSVERSQGSVAPSSEGGLKSESDEDDEGGDDGNDESIGDMSGFSEFLSGGKAWRRGEIDVVDLTEE